MDFIAIVSLGFYPTPVPTNTVRAAFVATYGLLDTSGDPLPLGAIGRGLDQFGFSMTIE